MLGRYSPTGSEICRAVPTGVVEILKNGKTKQRYEYRAYVPTKEGEIELNQWIRRAMEEIEEQGKTELFERIKEHCRRYGWLRKEKELNDWSLHCYYYDAYMHWEDFTIIWA